MSNEEAKKMLKAKLECFKNETSGINHDCNMRLCDGCLLNYEQGNMGEQKEALEMAIKALEQTELISSEDCISREKAVYVASGYCAPQNIADVLRRLPSVTPTRPHGEWIPIYLLDVEWGYKCSNCKETWLNEYNYCPECGCKMEVDDEEN